MRADVLKCTLLAAVLLILAACGTEKNNDARDFTISAIVTTPTSVTLEEKGVIFTVTDVVTTVFDPDNFMRGKISLNIHNTTEHRADIRNRIVIEQNIGGSWVGYRGIDIGGFIVLAPGEEKAITVDGAGPDHPGEFRLVSTVIINRQSQTVYTYFTVHNPDIKINNESKLQAIATTPTSVTLEVINGFSQDVLYIHGYYGIARVFDSGTMEEIPVIVTFEDYYPGFTTSAHRIGPRQTHRFTIHFGWRYGELPPGDYIIWKTVREVRYADGRITSGTRMIPFTVKEKSPYATPQFLAQVLRHGIGRDWMGPSVLVTGLCDEFEGWPIWVAAPAGGAVVNENNVPIPFDDIPIGAIIEIDFDGDVALSNPALIAGVHKIRILE